MILELQAQKELTAQAHLASTLYREEQSATKDISVFFSRLLVRIADPEFLAPIIDAADYHIARVQG